MTFYSYTILLAICLVSLCSCSESPDTPPLGPSISLLGNIPDADVEINSEVSLVVSVQAGDEVIRQMVITENGERVSVDRLAYQQETGLRTSWDANPLPLPENQNQDFTWTQFIKIGDEIDVTNEYVIEVVDAQGLTANYAFTITQVNTILPELTLLSAIPRIIAPSSTITFTITALAKRSDLNTIQFLEDGQAIDASRVSYRENGEGLAEVWDINPYKIPENLNRDFSWQVSLDIHNEEAATKSYQLILEDDAGNNASTQFFITTDNSLSVSSIRSKQWYNNDNVALPSCLDLNTGEVYLDTDDNISDCDLRDLGNGDDIEWDKRFTVENDAELRIPSDNAFIPGSFSSIVSAFNSGSTVEETEAKEGQWYLCRDREGRIFAFEFMRIAETTNDSQDFYTLRILKEKE